MAGSMLLIDASSFIHRAFHATPPRLTSSGESVGALLTSIKMLKNLVNEHKPRWVVTVFDHPGPNFRHALYPAYKANRTPKPDELVSQIDKLQSYASAMGINPVSIPNVEADDVLATIAKSCSDNGVEATIATRDKDLAAVVSDCVTLVDKDGSITDIEKVIETFGVKPVQVADWLALKGDSPDNIPGVKGCGAAKAAKLLSKYGSLDGVLQHRESIPGVLGERIRKSANELSEMKEVVQLNTNIQIPTMPSDYSRRKVDIDRLLILFEEHEFIELRDTMLRNITPQEEGLGVSAGAAQ